MKRRLLLAFFALMSAITLSPVSEVFAAASNPSAESWIQQRIRVFYSQARNLDPQVLRVGLVAYIRARQQGLDNKQLLTIIDYTKPSSEPRLYVLDLKRDKVLFNTWVSHGRNSGEVNSTSFSNQPGSLKSSIGVFRTDEPYIGGHGYSLRLVGLEPGINDNAYQRDIVVHGAWYVGPHIAKQIGRLGRSWGCPAVNQQLAKPIIDTIKGNTLIVAYYYDQNWLSHSNFVA